MGCCSKGSKIYADGEGPKNDKELSRFTPAKERKCHDCLFTLFFLAWWCGMIGIFAVGITKGEPETLLYGTDYKGKPCADKKTYYPRMNKDIVDAQQKGESLTDVQFYGICAKECPQKSSYICTYEKQKELDDAGLTGAALESAQESASDPYFDSGPCWFVPMQSSTVMFRCFPKKNETSLQQKKCVKATDENAYYDPDYDCNPANASSSIVIEGLTVIPGKCAHYDVRTVNSEKTYTPNKNCKTTVTFTQTTTRGATADNPLVDQLQDTAAIVGAFAGDLEKTLGEILMIGGALALVLGVTWLLLLKYCAGCIVWTTLSAVVACMVAASLYCSHLGGMLGTQYETILAEYNIKDPGKEALDKQDKNNKQAYEILAYLLWIATFVLLIVVIFLRTKVKVTIGIIREASRSLQSMPMLIAWPFIPFFMTMLLFIYFCAVSALVYSAGDLGLQNLTDTALSNINTTGVAGYSFNVSAISLSEFQQDKAKEFMLWYHLFGFLWANALINAVSMCTVAGAVSAYYWARTKKSGPQAEGFMGKRPISTALYCCFRYHFGSLCFGAMIVAIVQFIRIVLMYIDRQTKDLQKKNIFIKIFMKVIQCCMWCLEKVIKYISKNAYIMIGMRGKSFCASTFAAFSTILSNIAQVGMLSATSNVLLLLVRFTIASACGFFMFMLVDSNDYKPGGSKELTAPLLPVLVTILLAYCIASIFMNAYGLAIDTILLCFCEDKKANKPGEYFMSDELQKCIPGFKKGQKVKAEREAADAKKAEDVKLEVTPVESEGEVPDNYVQLDA